MRSVSKRRFTKPQAAEFYRRLAATRPIPQTELEFINPFTLLVAVVLSAQATDIGVNKATPALFAMADTPAKILAPAIVDLVRVDLAFERLAVFPQPKISFLPATLDTGPPGRTSFVELIGSMRAHAPPSLA